LPFQTKANYRAGKALELVHGDLCGPIKPTTPRGKTLFLLMVDNMSRYMWLVLLSAKSDASKLIKQVQAEAESGKKLKVLPPRPASSTTAMNSVCDGISRRPTPLNRTRLWSAGIKLLSGR
jgi:hypothetical protein